MALWVLIVAIANCTGRQPKTAHSQAFAKHFKMCVMFTCFCAVLVRPAM